MLPPFYINIDAHQHYFELAKH